VNGWDVGSWLVCSCGVQSGHAVVHFLFDEGCFC